MEKKRTDHFVCWLLYPVSFPITTSMIMMIFIQKIAYSYSFLRSLVFSLSKHLTGIIEYAHVYMFAFVFEWFGTDSDTMWHMPAFKWSMEAHFMTLAHKRTHTRARAHFLVQCMDWTLCCVPLLSKHVNAMFPFAFLLFNTLRLSTCWNGISCCIFLMRYQRI